MILILYEGSSMVDNKDLNIISKVNDNEGLIFLYLSFLGVLFLISARDLFFLQGSLELMSIPLYILFYLKRINMKFEIF